MQKRCVHSQHCAHIHGGSAVQLFASVYSEQSSIVIEKLQNPGQNIQAIKCFFASGLLLNL